MNCPSEHCPFNLSGECVHAMLEIEIEKRESIEKAVECIPKLNSVVNKMLGGYILIGSILLGSFGYTTIASNRSIERDNALTQQIKELSNTRTDDRLLLEGIIVELKILNETAIHIKKIAPPPFPFSNQSQETNG